MSEKAKDHEARTNLSAVRKAEGRSDLEERRLSLFL